MDREEEREKEEEKESGDTAGEGGEGEGWRGESKQKKAGEEGEKRNHPCSLTKLDKDLENGPLLCPNVQYIPVLIMRWFDLAVSILESYCS